MIESHRETTHFFKAVSLFRGMDEAEVLDVARMVRPFERGSGEALFQQGDAADGMYIIERGAVEIRARVPGDATMTLARLDAGDLLGELSLLDGGMRTATAVALTPTAGYWLGRRHFEFLRRDMKPASLTVMRRLIASTCGSARRSYARITSLLEPSQLRTAHGEQLTASLVEGSASSIPFEAMPLFSRLSPEERRGVLDLSQVVHAQRGARLYAQDAEAQDVFMVLRGAARTVLGQSAAAFQVAVHAPGCMVGLVGALDGEPYATSGFAAEPSVLLRMPRNALQALQSEPLPRSWHLSEHIHENLVWLLRRCTDHASRLQLERDLLAPTHGGTHV